MCTIFEQVLVQSILDRVRPERPSNGYSTGAWGAIRMSSWVKCWVDNGPRSVVVLSITRQLSGESGTPGISCAIVSVRSEYASFPSRTMVVFCVFPPRRPLPHLGERGRGARCARLSRLGLAGHVPATRGKVYDIPHHRWTGSFARASTSYSQCRAVSSTSCSSPFINRVVHSTHHLPRALLVCA